MSLMCRALCSALRVNVCSDVFAEALVELRTDAIASAPPLGPRCVTRVKRANLIRTEHSTSDVQQEPQAIGQTSRRRAAINGPHCCVCLRR